MESADIKLYEVVVDEKARNDINHYLRKKHFRSLPAQVQEVVLRFQNGDFEGDNILTFEEPTRIEVYKMRLPNPDVNVGKSNGYRVIYAIAVEHKLVVILTVYYKKEQETIDEKEIRTYIAMLISDHIPKIPYDDGEDEE